jgi:uncharacterized membrane protein YeaQ/YmgE (transglycosylase-associated protein family)
MITTTQKKILIRSIISIIIIALYVFGGKQAVKPDPKGLGFFFLIFAGAVFSLIVGILLTTIALIKKRHWVKSLLFILTAIGNTLMLIVYIRVDNDSNSILLYVLCYSGVAIGIAQLYMLINYYLNKGAFVSATH